mmetsp:Transcript_15890/g.25826  ORF Transcript_15890/g.25826 Transcript_15890/m.25826 type:complete len:91 (-) Transcript_15890:92-364(-)|eukprot:CAMPEP_0169065942 /NCGR_PEP_ID=MMETSP1015-20121227/2678_1 /TAXON_ID=342587 /ORGANISM="Karlodinium micrum, Strain CCMP2283" /LENGTH=90 /DNA_ID=CAMNT_0009124561 /DNA_START=69 /DNA_END=341 /DNA_ORIENTATION=+
MRGLLALLVLALSLNAGTAYRRDMGKEQIQNLKNTLKDLKQVSEHGKAGEAHRDASKVSAQDQKIHSDKRTSSGAVPTGASAEDPNEMSL